MCACAYHGLRVKVIRNLWESVLFTLVEVGVPWCLPLYGVLHEIWAMNFWPILSSPLPNSLWECWGYDAHLSIQLFMVTSRYQAQVIRLRWQAFSRATHLLGLFPLFGSCE